MWMALASSNDPTTLTTFGWPFRCHRICTSLLASSLSSSVGSLVFRIVLHAYATPVFRSLAVRVIPNCPFPRTAPKS